MKKFNQVVFQALGFLCLSFPSNSDAQIRAVSKVAVQCLKPCAGAGSFSVDANYQRTPAGQFCMVPNNYNGRFNFSDNGHRVILPDPSIMTFEGRYYATGTSDDYANGNFAIYVSDDLVNWQFFRTVFPDNQRQGDRLVLSQNGGRSFAFMWAPDLFLNPNEPDSIFLTFTAVECRAADYCSRGSNYQSVFSASISKTAFRAGGNFSSASDNRAYEPQWYAYTVNNMPGPFRNDGGWAQWHGASSIPVTGSADLFGYNPGQVNWVGDRMQFITGTPWYFHLDPRTYMSLDSFVFVDPQQQNKLYMLYAFTGSNYPFLGNNIATFPMLNHFQMNATSYEHLPLAYRRNIHNGVNGIDNGCIENGQEIEGCVAEGPAALYRNGWYYLMFSRNPTTSGAYGIYYRKARTFAGLSLASWTDTTVDEAPLIQSNERALPMGLSFGHGEAFKSVKEDRYYMIFHQKDSGTLWTRSPMLKELTFNNTTGEIESLTNNDPRGLRNDLNYFMIPRASCFE